MPRRVAVGKAFSVHACVDDVPAKQGARRVDVGQAFEAKATIADRGTTPDDRVRSFVVYAVLALSTVFILSAGGLGLLKGDFTGLQNVWGAVGPIYGGIATYFFAKPRGR
jgi:hypothetical protein